MAMTGQTLIDALHRLAAGLRVAGTDEAAENAWRVFLADMDADVRVLVDRDDLEWLEAAMRHSFEVGWTSALRRASELAGKVLEEAA